MLTLRAFNDTSNLDLRVFASITIALLDDAHQHILATSDPLRIVIGQFSPPLLHPSSDLFPSTSQNIFVHNHVHDRFPFLSDFKSIGMQCGNWLPILSALN